MAGTDERGRRLRTPEYVSAIPAFVWMVVFFALPLSLIAYYSLGHKPDFLTPISMQGLGLSSYHDALSGPFLQTFRNTLTIAVVGTALCLLIAFPFAYAVAVRMAPRWRGLAIGLVMIPFWTSFLIRTIGWRIILSPDGWLSHWMQSAGLRGSPIQILDTRYAVQLGVVYNYLPLMILPLFVALSRLEPALQEAARDLGARPSRTLRQVTVPLAMPGVIAGCLLVFIPLTGDYITATVLGGARGNMVGQLVASQFLLAQDWAEGSALAIVLIVMTLCVVGIFGIVGLGIRSVVRHQRALEPAWA